MAKTDLTIDLASMDTVLLDSAVEAVFTALKPLEGDTEGYQGVFVRVTPSYLNDNDERMLSRRIYIIGAGKKTVLKMTHLDIPHTVTIHVH